MIRKAKGVWWVNMPDFSSSIGSIQIQRGVGTSTNGASAFGATVNLKTTGLNKDVYARTNNTFGSYNTLKNNIEFGTGLMNENLLLTAGYPKLLLMDTWIEHLPI